MTLVDNNMRRFKGECAFVHVLASTGVNTHDGASAKFSTNSHSVQSAGNP